MTTIFVVYEGSTPGELNPAAAFSEIEFANQSFDIQVKEGLVDVNRGLYLARLDDVPEEDVFTLYSDTSALANNEFEGYALTVLRSVESNIDDWDEAALNVADEDFDNGDEDYVLN